MQYHYSASKIILTDEQNLLIGEVLFPAINATTVLLEHVFVNPNFEHQGIGSQLVAQFVKYVTEENLTVKLLDPFGKLEFEKHFEYRKLLITD